MNIVSDYLNTIKTELLPSKIHGIGTFAFENISIGTNVFPHWEGDSGYYDVDLYLIKNSYFINKILRKYFKIVNNTASVYLISNSHFLCPWKHFVNHSENPNIDMYGNCINTINKGDEILRNYKEISYSIEKNIYVI